MRVCTLASWFTVVGLVCFVGSAAAQETRTTIGVGYQYLHAEDSSFPLGMNLDVASTLTLRFAVVGELGWARSRSQSFGLRDVTTAWHAGGGMRWRLARNRRIRPYAQILIGIDRELRDIERFGSDSVSNFLVEPGGGITVRLGNRHEVFAQSDLRRIVNDDDGVNIFRFLTGVRFGVR